MDIATIISKTVEMINRIPTLSDVLVFEDNGFLDDEQKMRIRQRSVYAKVWCNGFDPKIQNPHAPHVLIIGDASIVVSIFEKASVNRKKLGAITCQDIAIAVAKSLTCAQAEGMECPLFLKRITPISELGAEYAGTVTCDVVFNTKAEL